MIVQECALASENALAKDWNRPEEDAAWAHLQQFAGPPSISPQIRAVDNQ